ncbi:hypothetical protein AruPA_21370 [Acidiphilium sp. PA]|uniref:hypothetical protein n=1 Tax=Acidiphilium sp. PA TaxID=2871705 RepID=UPI0022446B4A|nr:hypothetical protein [Acidiphilium sp. PA]MCW8309563.1 hypothetical protein [Acidiphilium sp. PA]
MTDPESFANLCGRELHQGIGMDWILNQVRGKRNLGCAQTPDVKVMNISDTRQAAQHGIDLCAIEAIRHRIHRKVHRIAQQGPGAEGDSHLEFA